MIGLSPLITILINTMEGKGKGPKVILSSVTFYSRAPGQ